MENAILYAGIEELNTIKTHVMELNEYEERNAELLKEYIISAIKTDDMELDAFLFSLGCYSGEPITVISRNKNNLIVSIKDSRYSIDSYLADSITV